VISVAFKTPLETRLGICIDKTAHQHRPDEYIGFTPTCPPHILQQNCAHAHNVAMFSSKCETFALHVPYACVEELFSKWGEQVHVKKTRTFL